MEQYFAFWSFFFSKQLHGPSFQTRNQMPGEFSVPAPAALIWPLTPLKTLKSPVVQSSWGMLTGSRWQEVLRWSLEVILWQNNLPNARAHHCLKVDPLWNIQLNQDIHEDFPCLDFGHSSEAWESRAHSESSPNSLCLGLWHWLILTMVLPTAG